ncbi:MAG: hypothetical protein JWQ03_3085 [Variovorax sp.]|nr:hypothetical protein [Variovorax sp.]
MSHPCKQSRLEWKRAQKTRWITEGFAIAREQAALICTEMADASDRRSAEDRLTGVKPREAAAKLLQAARRIGTMPRPAALPKHADVDDEEQANG